MGHGYDLHRLAPADHPGVRPLRLAGVVIPHTMGPVAHSDGDALFHAVTDAILGALGLPDIGQVFPDHDPANLGRDSSQFLAHAVVAAGRAGYSPVNLDATVILERPKLAPFKGALRAALAAALVIDPARANVKAKTHEGLDALGQGLAVEVHAVVLLARPERSGDAQNAR
ncbi:MAG: 2-C-methyl-D-erythritol 2,4-cyclodiphosphate synthase [Phycisphaeraceae bacterium]|nr:MAG: 2-C-methyl-D-erythritol 2,4-cyclodiphosphate synthase [Phycisphaeraceae bacterium]